MNAVRVKDLLKTFSKFFVSNILGTIVDTIVLWLFAHLVFSDTFYIWTPYFSRNIISPVISFEFAVLTNYLCAYMPAESGDESVFAFADVTTGYLAVSRSSVQSFECEFCRRMPKEVVVAEGCEIPSGVMDIIRSENILITEIPAFLFGAEHGRDVLFSHFKAVTVCSAVVSVVCFAVGMLLSCVYSLPTGAGIVAVNLFVFILFSAIGSVRA